MRTPSRQREAYTIFTSLAAILLAAACTGEVVGSDPTSDDPTLEPVTIRVLPASVDLNPGATQQFSAQVVDPAGGAVASSIAWSATGGAISTGGLYTAGDVPGSYRVIAQESDQGIADTADVSITQSAGPPSIIAAASGEDPDIAVGNAGTLHLAYVRQGSIYYRRGTMAGFESEIQVGNGVDPRVDLDSSGNPHIAFGTAYAGGSQVRYARWDGNGFTTATAVATGGLFRKPRIEIDSNDNAIISYEDRNQSQRIRYVRVASDGSVSAETIVGSDNNGGLAVAGGVYHFTWRSSTIQYSSSTGPGNSSSSVSISPAASDFSEMDAHEVDGSLHVAGEVTAAGGIYYINDAGGSWNAAQTYAVAEVSGAVADDVNPAIAIDAAGQVYITFSGSNQVGYILFVEPSGASRVELLDPDAGTTGGKYQNPNIEEAPQGGAFAAWATNGTVYVRGSISAN